MRTPRTPSGSTTVGDDISEKQCQFIWFVGHVTIMAGGSRFL